MTTDEPGNAMDIVVWAPLEETQPEGAQYAELHGAWKLWAYDNGQWYIGHKSVDVISGREDDIHNARSRAWQVYVALTRPEALTTNAPRAVARDVEVEICAEFQRVLDEEGIVPLTGEDDRPEYIEECLQRAALRFASFVRGKFKGSDA